MKAGERPKCSPVPYLVESGREEGQKPNFINPVENLVDISLVAKVLMDKIGGGVEGGRSTSSPGSPERST